ncbi:hypothetical protein AB4291_11510 [Vibrio cyclitrophicus]
MHIVISEQERKLIKLYRGISGSLKDGVYPNPYLDTPRKPKDTPEDIHLEADKWFEANPKIGVKARSQTIFCSTDIDQANYYADHGGSLLLIEPIGDYCLIYSSDVHDFDELRPDMRNSKDVAACLDSKHYVSTTDVNDLPSNFSGEVMMFCKEYKVTNV